MVGWCDGPTIWIIGQGPIALAVGAGVGCSDSFTLLYSFSSFSLSLGDGPIQTEILSQRAAKLKTTSQPPKYIFPIFHFLSHPQKVKCILVYICSPVHSSIRRTSRTLCDKIFSSNLSTDMQATLVIFGIQTEGDVLYREN